MRGSGEAGEAGAAQLNYRASIARHVIACAALCLAATPARAATIDRFTPDKVSPTVRQVTAHFSASMVSFGDPQTAAPLTAQCPVAGAGRWIDTRTWVYDFERDVPGGIACTFLLRDGTKSLAGEAIRGRRAFQVSTGGPIIKRSLPGTWEALPEDGQTFYLVTNGETDPASLRRHVGFEVDGLPERIGVEIVEGEERAAILKQTPRWSRADDDKLVVLIRAKRSFPQKAKVRLLWGAGVASPSGVATTADQVLLFKTRTPFTVEAECTRENAKSDCVPLTRIALQFSAPVAWEQARAITLTDPAGKTYPVKEPDDADPEVSWIEFAGPFPESSSLNFTFPASLRDNTGRALPARQASTITVKTAPTPPLAKFAARFGIVEWEGDRALPVTLRNVERGLAAANLRVTAEPDAGAASAGAQAAAEQPPGGLAGGALRVPGGDVKAILSWLRSVAVARRSKSVFANAAAAGTQGATVKNFTLPKPGDEKEFEVVGIPFETPGLYVVELSSPRLGASLLGKKAPMFVQAAALVTDLSVHFKWGRESSLAWVTTLGSAKPVKGAKVDVHDCNGNVLASADTDGDGIARFAALAAESSLPTCDNEPDESDEDYPGSREYYSAAALRGLESGLFVTARSAGDLSFVATGWSQGIETWRFGLSEDWWEMSGPSTPLVAHTIFDRQLYRGGDTVGMKLLLRSRTLSGFALPDAALLPKSLVVRHLGSDQTYEMPLAWDANAVSVQDWKIPANAKLGTYQVELTGGADSLTAGNFRVEQFRVPLLKANLTLPDQPEPGVTSLPVDLAIQYLAGGGAGGLAVTLRSRIRAATVRAPQELDSFVFGNGPVVEGIVRGGQDDSQDEARPAVHQRRELKLDNGGGTRSEVDQLPDVAAVSELLVEAEFRDPNGEMQTVATTRQLWPAALVPAIDVEDWTGQQGRVKARVAVLDRSGKAAARVPVRVDLYSRTTYSNRKRLLGGFYSYDSTTETKKVGLFCEGLTDHRGILDCNVVTQQRGEVVLQASVSDAAGRSATANADTWVEGRDSGFQTANDNRIDLIPEKPSYEPGETARFQVRMPFQHATALVTVDREGVGAARVVEVDAANPVVEVPILGEYAPNIFVSALLLRARVGDVQPTAMVDLGRPAYKLGLGEVRVGYAAHALGVSVTSDREVYRVRDKAIVRVAVRTKDGTALPAGAEVALAAVDEGLLELSPNKSWDLLEAMMGKRSDEVETCTAQGEVIGKRHYGRKALPVGGGGGRQATRELFDTLLLWNPRVALDATGQASVEIPLNDSVTGFRIVAVANAGLDLFGTGSASIRSTQDLMLLAGIPPLVRNGDRLDADVTVRNASQQPMQVIVKGTVEGLAAPLAPQSLTLAAGEARTVAWPITVPEGAAQLRYLIEAAADSGPSDRLAVTQQVKTPVPVQTLQATLAGYQGPLRERIEMPAGALANAGGVDVQFASSLADTGEAAREWLRNYPYSCLEQKVSIAIGLGDDARWAALMDSLPGYLDDNGLAKFFPSAVRGSDALTAYILSVADAAGRQIPAALRDRMVAGLRAFVAGSLKAGSGFSSGLDLTLRKLGAIAALVRLHAAEPNMLGSITIEPEMWPTSALLDWWSIVADIKDLSGRDAKMHTAESLLRSRLYLSGTTATLTTSALDNSWSLTGDKDTNNARLLLFVVEHQLWKEDLPRLAHGMTSQSERGRWSTTVADAWATVAMMKFAKVFEAEPVSGTTQVSLAGTGQTATWGAKAPEPLHFAWPAAAADLELTHAGSGKPWITFVSRAARPLTAPVESGYRITKTLTALDPRVAGTSSRGDRVRVRLDIDAQRDVNWVVVDDPIVAGASHLGLGLARESRIEPETARSGDDRQSDFDYPPSYVERTTDSYRAYFEYLSKGRHHLEYEVRLNQSGHFRLPPSRVEALYAAELFGEIPNADVDVAP